MTGLLKNIHVNIPFEMLIDFQILFEHMKNLKENPPIVTIEPHREEDVIPSLKYLEKIWPW